MTWRIRIPYRSREDSLVDVASTARALKGEDRAVARELAIQAMIDDDLRSAGQLIDRLEAAGPEERRATLDRARRSADLPSIREVEEQRRFEVANEAGALRARATSPWVLCAEPACNQVPVNEVGAPVASTVNRWWCPQHAHLAQPGDLEQRQLPIRISPSGALVEYDPASDEAELAREESRRRRLEEEAAAREHTAAEAAEHERLRAEACRREVPEGVPG